MRLRDTFRRHHDEDGGDTLESAAAATGVPEPMEFRPRHDGYYQPVASGTESPASQGFLRFAGRRVYWAPGDTPADALPAALGGAGDAWAGDYTPAGRFTVQRRFERPIIFTVLSFEPAGFVARQTTTAPPRTSEVNYRFVGGESESST